ncbi:MAG: AI-2E family transporter [Deltaproteobacteria bacterium]|nr:AI-2E family transporter [Deltaproteobacteria bacterium]
MSDRDNIPRWVLWLGVSVATGWLLYTLRGVLAPVFFAFLIAYMLDPLVDRIEANRLLRGKPIARAVGIAVLLVGSFALAAVAILVIVPMVYEEVASFLRRLPALVAHSRAALEPMLAEYGLEIPTSVGQALEELHLDIQSVLTKGYTPVTAVVKWLLGGTASALGAIIAALIVPVFAFYLLYDFDVIVAKVGELIPPRHRPQANSFFRDVDLVLGQFFRGQFTVMAILAVLYAVGYGSIGVPLALPIGIMAGFLSFIPYVGSTLALLTALGADSVGAWSSYRDSGLGGFRHHSEDHGRHRWNFCDHRVVCATGRRRALGVHGGAPCRARGCGQQDSASANPRAIPRVRVFRRGPCRWRQR